MREGENSVQKWGVFTTKVQRFDSDAKMWPQTKLRSSASRLGEKLEGFAKLRGFQKMCAECSRCGVFTQKVESFSF